MLTNMLPIGNVALYNSCSPNLGLHPLFYIRNMLMYRSGYCIHLPNTACCDTWDNVLFPHYLDQLTKGVVFPYFLYLITHVATVTNLYVSSCAKILRNCISRQATFGFSELIERI